MNPLEAITATGPQASLAVAPRPQPEPNSGPTFSDLISRGLDQVETRVDHANDMVRRFVTDSSIPVHEVTIALEEARIAVELAMQVRTRMVEAYREVMNMQL